jgi:exosortase
MPQSASVLHPRRPALAFVGCLVLLTLLAWTPLSQVVALALENPEYSYILLVVPISLGFALTQSSARSGKEISGLVSGSVLGLAALALAVLAWKHSFADPTAALSLKMLAVVVAIWATFLLLFGRARFTSQLFPLSILILLVPLPESAISTIVWFLQAGSTQVAFYLFRLFRLPVTREGFVLLLPSLEIEVARECSGIRSTAMLFLVALVLAQLFLRSWQRKLLLVSCVIPIGLLRNGLRVFVLAYLGEYVDQSWLDGNLHHRGGILFFGLGLAMLVALLMALYKSEQKTNIEAQSA